MIIVTVCTSCPHVRSWVVTTGPAHFLGGGHKRRTTPGLRLFDELGRVFFCLSFVFWVDIMFCFWLSIPVQSIA